MRTWSAIAVCTKRGSRLPNAYIMTPFDSPRGDSVNSCGLPRGNPQTMAAVRTRRGGTSYADKSSCSNDVAAERGTRRTTGRISEESCR